MPVSEGHLCEGWKTVAFTEAASKMAASRGQWGVALSAHKTRKFCPTVNNMAWCTLKHARA
jgi:hypothetical protein